jgi:putative phosphoesterase
LTVRLAILSDIHDNVWKLAVALERAQGCDAMICCGDLCSPFIVHQLGRGFANPVHVVFGNNDADLYRITSIAGKYPHLRLYGELFTGEFCGRKIAVNHFDYIARPLAASQEYDAVFFGHNHRREIGRVGRTVIVNPGAVMGAAFAADGIREDVPSTLAIYNAGTNEANLIEL